MTQIPLMNTRDAAGVIWKDLSQQAIVLMIQAGMIQGMKLSRDYMATRESVMRLTSRIHMQEGKTYQVRDGYAVEVDGRALQAPKAASPWRGRDFSAIMVDYVDALKNVRQIESQLASNEYVNSKGGQGGVWHRNALTAWGFKKQEFEKFQQEVNEYIEAHPESESQALVLQYLNI